MAKKSILADEDIKKTVFKALENRLEQVRGAPLSSGREILKSYLSGGTITASQAIKAQCCECMGYYTDGRQDCESYLCPLYPYMPYGKMRKSRNKGDAQML